MKKALFIFLLLIMALPLVSFAEGEAPMASAVNTTQAQDDPGDDAPSLDYDAD